MRLAVAADGSVTYACGMIMGHVTPPADKEMSERHVVVAAMVRSMGA